MARESGLSVPTLTGHWMRASLGGELRPPHSKKGLWVAHSASSGDDYHAVTLSHGPSPNFSTAFRYIPIIFILKMGKLRHRAI